MVAATVSGKKWGGTFHLCHPDDARSNRPNVEPFDCYRLVTVYDEQIGDRVNIPHLLAVLRDRNNTIAKVRALHAQGPSDGACTNTDCGCHGYPTCLHCNEYNAKGVMWPCDTIAALDSQEPLS